MLADTARVTNVRIIIIIISGLETDCAYSYNSAARMGHSYFRNTT